MNVVLVVFCLPLLSPMAAGCEVITHQEKEIFGSAGVCEVKESL